jgi:hypothetical protein
MKWRDKFGIYGHPRTKEHAPLPTWVTNYKSSSTFDNTHNHESVAPKKSPTANKEYNYKY